MIVGAPSRCLSTLKDFMHYGGVRQTRALLPDVSNVENLLVTKPVNATATFIRDVELYHNLTHPYLLKCHGYAACENDQRVINHQAAGSRQEWHDGLSRLSGREIVYYVTLWEDCGELQDVRSYVSDSRQRSIAIMHDIAKAVQYLHSRRIPHGSLRLINILVRNGHAKLANFHLGHRCHKFKCRSRQLVQNDRFTAPEFFAGCGGDVPCASFAADVFHLGLCWLELLTGEPPYGMLPNEDVVAVLSGQQSYPCPDGADAHVWSKLSKLIAHNPADRPTIDEVVDMFASMATGTAG